jgi:hypothetical protein
MDRRRLIPLVVALAGLALFWWTRTGEQESPFPDVETDVSDCQANLLAIYDGLRAYKERYGQAPEGSGVAFFADLVAKGIWEGSVAVTERLTCPGVNAAPVPPGTDFSNLASLTTASSAYAARDTEAHPLAKFPSGGPELEAIMSCDNSSGMNHDGVMNVLYSDRTVKTLMLDELIERGAVPAGTTSLPVGPDSPFEDLRSFVAE